MTTTPAAIQKQIKALEAERETIVQQERNSCTFEQIGDNRPDVQPYNFVETRNRIYEINEDILRFKVALQKANTSLLIDEAGTTAAELLIRMAQVSEELHRVTSLSAKPQKSTSGYSHSFDGSPVYTCANYSVEQAEQYRKSMQETLSELQIKLDRFNLTAEIYVED